MYRVMAEAAPPYNSGDTRAPSLMPLTAGARLGPYEILSPLGAGGMGEVYRGRDTRLDRIVAIKVLRAQVAADPDRRQRFEREARIISQLNHPHICALFDVGHHELSIGSEQAVDYLVMEDLEGQTLDERLGRSQDRPLPIPEALTIAIQIAEALDAAHHKGIVHRDLKPANVMLTKAGAKLLDFGIAKLAAPSHPSRDVPQGVKPPSPTGAATIPPTLTVEGTLLGTIQYMSPEQLEGREADARSDLFAFGAVLFEMVAGRRAFAGESQANVIAAILEHDPPPISTLQPLTPPALAHVITKCLAKNPEARWQSASDVKRQLEWIAATARSTASPTTAGPRSRGAARVAWSVAAVALLVALLAGGALTWRVWTAPQAQTAPPRVSRFTIASSGATALCIAADRGLAITPDGTRVVYVGNKGTQLFVRPLEQLDPTAIATGTDLRAVFVSPDGQWAGFVDTNATLKRVAIAGGPATTIVQMDAASRGATWAPDNTIIFATPDPCDRPAARVGDGRRCDRADEARQRAR